MTQPASPLSLTDIRAAAARIAPYIHRTPLLRNRSIDERAGMPVRLKCENLQRAGAFKIRGAMNALLRLSDEERARGVVAFSSGNHAQGVALAASLLGIRATIVMPENAIRSKVEATEAYGARVVQGNVTASTRDDIARRIAEEEGASIVPPFDHDDVIAGAGTVGLEIVEEWPEVRTILVPTGGGGLLAGVALAVTSIDPRIEVFGVEPAAGNDVQRSFALGEIVRIEPPDTIADGARTLAVGARNFRIIQERVKGILSVEDDRLLEVMRFVVYRTKLLVEATGALGLTALLDSVENSSTENFKPPVAVVLSGGNADLSLLSPR